VIYLVSAVPFFLTGLFLSVLFARRTEGIAQLYAFDLTGAALACLAVVPLLNTMGAPNAIVLAAAAMAAAAALWAEGSGYRVLGVSVAVLFAALGIANRSGKFIDIVYAKGMFRDPAWVLYARWNAISRIEVNEQGGAKVIVIDADASTYIMSDDPKHLRPESRQNLFSAAPSAANVLRPNGNYAIIGPGGGVDVMRAIASGNSTVTGIEINPIIVNNVMRGRFSDFAQHLYDRPDVHIHVSDGRSWVRSSQDRFDVLQMTLVDTWASTAAGAFALSENNLYTLEAFREYFDHLKPDGFLAITRWEFKQPREALRVVSVAMEALRLSGIHDDLPSHFIIVSDGPLNTDGRPVTVLAKKSAFTPAEEQAVLAHLSRYPNLALLYAPFSADAALAAGNQPFHDLILSRDPWKFARGYAYDVSPVTDNSPFFFFNLKPEQVWNTRSDQGIDWKVNVGLVILGVVLVVSILAVLLFLVLPLALQGNSSLANLPSLTYFIAIGLGYILVEIAFIQRFVLFLGHPVYALTVVIFLMLLSSGAGSFASRRLLEGRNGEASTASLRTGLLLAAIVAALAIYAGVLPPLLRTAVGAPFSLKLVLSAVLIAPLGFLMGMPFPTGLRALSQSSQQGAGSIEWAWAMNAASSVLGSVLAMVIAIQYGLTVTLATGAFTYLAAVVFVPRQRRS
ncbi:MAG TPA: hypothetical protein VG892_11130, partial [Terriglobales bacterium]|nr:hypothetical protein [Terriglobales bacterium]